MTWIVVAIAGWLLVALVVSLFAWALARAASIGDRQHHAPATSERGGGADVSSVERRSGLKDRRAGDRPWTVEAPGRRAEDVLRQDLAEAHRALRDAEHRLAEIEARESA